MTPDSEDFWFLPLGGCGEIGMNMNLYGHDESWIMVDCGITFRDPDGSNASGHSIQMPNPDFIAKRHQRLQALLLTHAHEDHIGAVPHLWPKLRCPIFTTAFTAELLRRKLAEHGLEERVPVHIVEPGERFQIGVFDVEWVAHTHSIPDPCGVVLRTPVGSVFHTADWKLDKNPLIGHQYNEEHYRNIGDSGIDALVCDSTCANVSGRSLSESALLPGLMTHAETCQGRIIVACFGSNIARLHTLASVAESTGRHLGLLGRSLVNTASAAQTVGLWRHTRSLVDASHMAYLPSNTLMLVVTGSQAEPKSALNRLSLGHFRDLELEPNDTVIFSSRAIPGNEEAINAMIERLQQMGVNIITSDSSEQPIHTSGHPAAEELAELYTLIKPHLLIPVHGESEHMSAQVELAKQHGIQKQLLGKNGDLFIISPNKAIRRQAVQTGRLGLSKRHLVPIVPNKNQTELPLA